MCVVFLSVLPVSPFWSLIIVVPIMFGIGYVVQRFLLSHVSVQMAERRDAGLAAVRLLAPRRSQ